ncbi:protein MAIN-LIKE 1-like, partial [Lolium rigidum]|uniref:protein MAIN-LIKE 1-like n=1 Tax=Lolium rigidum TaxID=89674 RepID=UPI001F5CE728
MVWLLDQEYDRDHRAFHMTEKRTVLQPLKIRYHGTVSEMSYDERYTEFIQPTDLLPFITLVSRGANMNAAALTALVDRWRPETHTFHLRAGEMTPTLQDVSMILGLPIQGEPLCMNTASDGWRGQMEDLVGMAPPPPADPKERTPAGAPFAWIRANFGTCPQGANEDTIKTYTRVYLWYMISRTLFADSGGKLANWCWLKALTVLEHQWSWGTAALAYLYRQVMICYVYYSSIVVC